MIKWLDKLASKNMDLDEDKINRVTLKDAAFLLLISPLLYVLMLPFLILFALFELLEVVCALLIAAAILASPVSLYLIFTGQSSTAKIVIACVSTFILVSRYLVYPLAKHTDRYQRFKARLLRV